MFGNLNKALDKMFSTYFNRITENFLHVTNVLSKRRRAFFIEDKFLEFAKQIFEIRDDEFIMSSSEGVDKLIKELNDSNE